MGIIVAGFDLGCHIFCPFVHLQGLIGLAEARADALGDDEQSQEQDTAGQDHPVHDEDVRTGHDEVHVQQQEERQRKAAETAAQREAEAQESLKPKPAECTQFELNIYSAAAWHSFGENEEILEQSRQFKSPELDHGLCNAYGLPVLSFRIQALDELAQLDEDDDAEAARNTMREKRIQQLLRHQIEQHAETLWHVSSHLQRSALYYDSELARQYRMHPAWTDPDYAEGEPEHSVPEQVAKLNLLNIHILLPENLVHHWAESAREQMLRMLAAEYSILPEQIKIEHHFICQDDAYSAWLKLLEQIAQQEHECSLIINADSEIDQEWLDEQLWQTEQYIASEFAASWCAAGSKTSICGLAPRKTLKITLNEPQAAQFLQQNQLNELAQLEQDQPFILMLDDAADVRTAKKLQRNFAETAVEMHHFLYTRKIFGDTQRVAKIFAFMLGMHLPEELTGMVYSTDMDSAYAYFKAYPDEKYS